jgi:cytochrome c-type biogenesis protein CcmH/NrfG
LIGAASLPSKVSAALCGEVVIQGPDGKAVARPVDREILQRSRTMRRTITWLLLFFCVACLAALAVYGKALWTDPKNARAHYNRGALHMGECEYDQAITDFTEAIRLDPKLVEAYFNRGLAYKKNGDKSKAEEDFAQAKKLGYKSVQNK